jgi:hypothetical protein
MDENHFDVVIARANTPDAMVGAWVYWSTLSEEARAEMVPLGDIFASRPPYNNVRARPSGPAVTSLEGALALAQGPDVAREVLGVELAQSPLVIFVFVAPWTPIPAELVRWKRVLIIDLNLGEELWPVVYAAAHVHVVGHDAGVAQHAMDCRRSFDRSRLTYAVECAKEFSGALLTWIRFRSPEPIPWLVRVVQCMARDDSAQEPGIDMLSVLLAMRAREMLRTFPDISGAVCEWEAMPDAGRSGTVALADEGRIVEIARRNAIVHIIQSAAVRYVIAAPNGKKCWYRGLGVSNCPLWQKRTCAALVAGPARAYEEAGMRIDFVFMWTYCPHNDMIHVAVRSTGTGINQHKLARTIMGYGKQRGKGGATLGSFYIQGAANLDNILRILPPSDIREFDPAEVSVES